MQVQEHFRLVPFQTWYYNPGIDGAKGQSVQEMAVMKHIWMPTAINLAESGGEMCRNIAGKEFTCEIGFITDTIFNPS